MIVKKGEYLKQILQEAIKKRENGLHTEPNTQNQSTHCASFSQMVYFFYV